MKKEKGIEFFKNNQKQKENESRCTAIEFVGTVGTIGDRIAFLPQRNALRFGAEATGHEHRPTRRQTHELIGRAHRRCCTFNSQV